MPEAHSDPALPAPDPATIARWQAGEAARRAFREAQKARIAARLAAAEAAGKTSKAAGD